MSESGLLSRKREQFAKNVAVNKNVLDVNGNF